LLLLDCLYLCLRADFQTIIPEEPPMIVLLMGDEVDVVDNDTVTSEERILKKIQEVEALETQQCQHLNL